MVVICQAGKLAVKTDHLPKVFKHGGFHIVVKTHTRHAAKESKSVDVTFKHPSQLLIIKHAGKKHSRVRQHGDKAQDLAARPTDLKPAKLGPVDLSYLTWKKHEVLVSPKKTRSDAGDKTPERINRAVVAALGEHLKKTRGANLRVIFKGALNKRVVRIQATWFCLFSLIKTLSLDSSPDRVRVNTQICGNGADLPMLGIE